MGPLGVPELIVIFVVALLVFGPRKLPELGRSLGKGLSEFKRASNDLRNTLEEEIRRRRTAHGVDDAAHASPRTRGGTRDGAATPRRCETEPETVARGQHPA